MTLNFTIKNQHIERTDNEMVVANSNNYLYAHFDFCTEEWDGITKSVNFIKGDEAYTVILDDDLTALVPHEVIVEGAFEVSCFGGDLITNDTAKVRVAKSGYTKGKAPKDPTPDVYSSILKECEETRKIAQSIEDARIDTFSIDNEVIEPDEERNVNIALGENMEYKDGILNSKPTARSEEWEMIFETTLSTSQQYLLISTDKNGKALDLAKVKILFDTGTTSQAEQLLIKVSNKYTGTTKSAGAIGMSNAGAISTSKRYGVVNMWIDGFVCLSIGYGNTDNLISNYSLGYNEQISKIDKILLRLNNATYIPAGTHFKIYGVQNG